MENYEQKYKEALEKLQEALAPTEDGCKTSGLTRGCIENIFPELKDSDDERIRKELIESFEWFCGDYPETTTWGKDDNLLVKDIIAWLKKQGEQIHTNSEKVESRWTDEDEETLQDCCGAVSAADYYTIEDKEEIENWLFSLKQRMMAPFDYDNANIHQKNFAPKVKPKFKPGDWIVTPKNEVLQVTSIAEGTTYRFNNESTYWETCYCDEKCRLWTIQDAKQGDVLASGHNILILKELVYDWSCDGTPNAVKAYCGIKPNGNFELGKENWCFCGTLYIHPATKEERKQLFQKMKEDGWEWDAKKKKLKEIQ